LLTNLNSYNIKIEKANKIRQIVQTPAISQQLRKEGFRFFIKGDIFFVYHNAIQWPDVYDFLKN